MAYDPYAPPAEIAVEEENRGESRYRGPDYNSERRPVGIVFLLSVVTLGVYPIIWLFRRRPFLDSLDTSVKLGTSLPTFVAVLNVMNLGFAAFGATLSSRDRAGVDGVDRILQLAAGIAMLITVFRVASILRSDFSRTGRMISVSGVMVFFFGTLYLQYKINEAADTEPLKRRKKKKKKSVPPPEDGSAPPDHSSSSSQPGQ